MRDAIARRKRRAAPMFLLIGAAMVAFVAANAHLVYVAVNSEPDCVPHLKEKASRPGQFRAAAPAC